MSITITTAMPPLARWDLQINRIGRRFRYTYGLMHVHGSGDGCLLSTKLG